MAAYTPETLSSSFTVSWPSRIRKAAWWGETKGSSGKRMAPRWRPTLQPLAISRKRWPRAGPALTLRMNRLGTGAGAAGRGAGARPGNAAGRGGSVPERRGGRAGRQRREGARPGGGDDGGGAGGLAGGSRGASPRLSAGFAPHRPCCVEHVAGRANHAELTHQEAGHGAGVGHCRNLLGSRVNAQVRGSLLGRCVAHPQSHSYDCDVSMIRLNDILHPGQGLPSRPGSGRHQEGLRLLGQGAPGAAPEVGRALPGPPARGGRHPGRAQAGRGVASSPGSCTTPSRTPSPPRTS